ncbi:MAG: class II aldolase/adducin family protein [Pseudomonadota bacterium]
MPRLPDLTQRKDLIAHCQRMNALGINQGTSGNISLRNKRGFLISASGVPYDAMEPAHAVQMDLDGGYTGAVLPSSEWRMHLDIYRSRPEASAVVHTHSPHATALACLREDVPAFHYMIGVTGGASLRCSAYASFGTEALSEAMLVALEDRRACLLGNHGMICFHDTLPKALALAVEVEALCQQYAIARQTGEPVILSDAEMTDILKRFGAYGKQPDELEDGQVVAFEPPLRRDA